MEFKKGDKILFTCRTGQVRLEDSPLYQAFVIVAKGRRE